jgi:hypothetical protein
MASQFEIDCALMAGASYISTRDDKNKFPIPTGWEKITNPDSHFSDAGTGFEAVSFQRGTGADAEIVISFAGTYDAVDKLADINLGLGNGDTQLYQAVEYYLQIKAENPDAKITLTGHSLGGGLASLVAVFFGEKAITFDQAPLAFSAMKSGSGEDQRYVPAEILSYLYEQEDGLAPELQQAYTKAIHSLEAYIAQQASTGGIPNSQLVSNIRVDGEFLSGVFPIGKVDFIGSTPAANVLTHGPGPTGLFAGLDLHSMALLTAFLQSDQSAAAGQTLRDATTKLTDLLGMIFDKNLYAYDTDPNSDKTNFLEHLVRHEFGNAPGVTTADHMLERFTSDLWKIAQDGGLTMSNSDLAKALTAFAMQAYYENRPESDETLFDPVSGGIHFDRADVADTLAAAKGYAMYFTNYLATLPAEDRNLIVAQLPNLLDWYIQAGGGGMTATAGDQRAFMLGGSGSDNLTGGSQADVLVGNGGSDTLTGGAGDDILLGGDDIDADILKGGSGNDSYYTSANDIVEDSDHSGTIYYNGKNGSSSGDSIFIGKSDLVTFFYEK